MLVVVVTRSGPLIERPNESSHMQTGIKVFKTTCPGVQGWTGVDREVGAYHSKGSRSADKEQKKKT